MDRVQIRPESRPAPEATPFRVAGTFTYDFTSARGTEVWRVFVHVPPGQAPEAGWPLLALTDGNAVIGLAVGALRIFGGHTAGTDVEPGVLVAVGYPTDEPYDPLRRSWDLSPPPGRSYPPFEPGGPPVRTGGADAFLAFIEDEVLPFVETLAPIDASRRTLFGHSFGGLFALHALFGGSRAFTRFVASSPTIYWEDAALLRAEERFAASGFGRNVVVQLSAGEYEGDRLAPFQYGRDDTAKRLDGLRTARTLALAKEMAARLRCLRGVLASFEAYAAETHMTMIPVAVSRALRVAFGRDTAGAGQ